MKKVNALMRRVLSFCMVAMLAVGMLVVPSEKVAAETSANQNIQDAKNAVVQVMVCVQNKLGDWYNLVGGTGFLVGTEANAQYVITNDHVANATSTNWLTDEIIQGMVAISEKDDYTKIKTKVRVVLKRDSYIDATVVQSSTEADLAILKLDQPIYNRAPVALDAENEPQSTETVYTLGFPGIVQAYQDDKIYTSDDVTVTDGSISKIAASSAITGSPITYINHSARISEGNSGGPLLNAEGNVIGVNSWSASTDQTSYYYSIQIVEVTDLLDAMGIDYMKAGDKVSEGDTEETEETEEPAAGDTETEEGTDTEAATGNEGVAAAPAEPDNSAAVALMADLSEAIKSAKKLDTSGYTKESVAAFDEALTAAKNTEKLGDLAKEDEIQNAIDKLDAAQKGLEQKSGLNLTLILIIAVVAVILIVVIVLVAVSSSKKKREQEEAARKASAARQQAMNMNNNMQGGFQQNQGFAPRDSSAFRSADDGSTPTGILNDGSSATTVLGNAGMPTATLIRKKTGEKITIDKTEFRIGKERNKVDYCITGNSNISRTHATIVYRNGAFAIVDNNATNGTNVNGVAVPAGKERALTGNETIRLADEEFLFRA